VKVMTTMEFNFLWSRSLRKLTIPTGSCSSQAWYASARLVAAWLIIRL